MHRRRSSALVATLGAAVLAVGLSACGGDTDGGGAASTAASTTAPNTEATTVTAPDPDSSLTGTWVDPDGNGYLTFDDKGGVTGSDACNGIRSTYETGDETGDGADSVTASVAPFPTTMMACGDGWSQWLLGVSTVELHGDSLTVLDQDGGELGTLVPGEAPE
ncbi:META domain-containing protein [Corynebacterium sp. AOP40-9SA-29]|uniref:META domain-containing protein n=1 Tax=Corynebacterium sp. AOP40-9SA-29 TaxID=3457677 RepID=UPI004033AA7D